MAVYGYARVSTTDQDPALQLDALASACERIWTDHASGAKADRPQLAEVLDRLRPGDTLVVWKLDRLGRNLSHLMEIVNGLAERGVEFRSLTEGFDTSTAGGRLIFQVFGAFAEFERAQMLERTAAGLAAARARGRTGGRKPALSPAKTRTALALYDAKSMTVGEIADHLGVSRATIHRIVQRRDGATDTD